MNAKISRSDDDFLVEVFEDNTTIAMGIFAHAQQAFDFAQTYTTNISWNI